MSLSIVVRSVLSTARQIAAFGAVPALAAGMVSPAFGSPASQTGGGVAENTLQEVTVTATRRESTIQDVPATVAAFSGEELRERRIDSSLQLQYRTPGLVISTDQASNNIYIRGVGSSLLGITTGNSVATYLDGVYIPQAVQVFQSLADVERVEVLKGPQATLYGRNATGGAISIVTPEPTEETRGFAEASVGNLGAYGLRGAIGGGLSDTVSGRISLEYTQRDGFTRNELLGKDIDGTDRRGARGALKWSPTDDFDAVLRADVTQSRGSEGGLRLASPNSFYYTAPIPTFPAAPYIADPRVVRNDIDNRLPIDDQGVNLTLNWRTGLGKLTSISSYRKFEIENQATDLDGTGNNMISQPEQDISSESVYQELLLASDSEAGFQWLLGANYFEENADNKQVLFLALPLNPTGPPAIAPILIDQARDRGLDASAWAVFLDGTLRLSDAWSLIAGVRYSKETKEFVSRVRTDVNIPPILNPAPTDVTTRGKRSWSDTSPRFGIEYRPTPDLLAYFTATKGFKSGGFNIQTANNVFDQEEIWAYELGAKSTLLDGRLIANAAVFYYDYTDLQINKLDQTLALNITNASSAKIQGLDVSLDWRAAEFVTLGTSLSFLDTEYGDLELCNDRLGQCPPAANATSRPQLVNVRGNSLTNAPEFSGSVYGRVEVPVASGTLVVQADAYHRTRQYFTEFQDDFVSSGAYTALNARVAWRAPSGRWEIAAFGNNLTDELITVQAAVAGRPPQGDIAGDILIERYAPPRTYGVSLKLDF
jgi:iron complex outermembrane receptor protein